MPLFGQEHVARYRETAGDEGHDWQGTKTLLLTTTGRRSGEPRELPLIYGRHGDDYLVVASKGGAPEHPAWYLNLEANPTVKVQVKADKFTARAHTANAQERAALWPRMVEIYGPYSDYQQKTDRQIPVVVLKRV
jgi:deazaflavin-dependent oxidoreductase (nitroreductase family)